MKHTPASPAAPLFAVFWSPLGRLESAKLIAVLAAIAQYLMTDAFAGAFILVFVAGLMDYRIGVRSAKLMKLYDPLIAHRGWLGKMSGFCLLLLIRALEFYLHGQGFLDTHAALATGVALSLFAVDVQSIAHHREELGLQPIPALGDLISFVQRFARSKIPPDSASPKA